jgi:hypothetical protein
LLPSTSEPTTDATPLVMSTGVCTSAADSEVAAVKVPADTAAAVINAFAATSPLTLSDAAVSDVAVSAFATTTAELSEPPTVSDPGIATTWVDEPIYKKTTKNTSQPTKKNRNRKRTKTLSE